MAFKLSAPSPSSIVCAAASRRRPKARPGEIDWHTPEPMPPRPTIPAIGAEEFPVFHAFQRQAQKQRFPAAIEAGGAASALVLVGSNALLTAPGSARLRAAVDQLDLLVVVDPFLTASAEQADVVLPATTFGEDAPLSLPGGEGAWPDDKLIFSLARALGFASSFPWQTLEEAEHARRGPRKSKAAPLDPSTLTIRSAVLEKAGQPGLPVWTPPSDAPSPEFPLILVAGPRTRAFINSQLREAPSVRAKMPRPLARLHPAAATARGIADGDPVIVRTKVGSVQFWAELSGDIHPEVVVVPHGWLRPTPTRSPTSADWILSRAFRRFGPAPVRSLDLDRDERLIEQDAVLRGLEVIELSPGHCPHEGAHEADGEDHGERDEHVED